MNENAKAIKIAKHKIRWFEYQERYIENVQ